MAKKWEKTVKKDKKIAKNTIFLKKYSIGFNTELTHSNIRQLGVSGKLSFLNRNIFKGSEILKFSVQGSFLDSKDAADDEKLLNAWEIGGDVSIELPRILFPFKPDKIIPKNMSPNSIFTVGTSLQKNIGLDKQKFTGIEADYMNSVVYADAALKSFMDKCKKQKWYKNTLFVFIADHGHATPSSQSPSFNKYNRIPLLFYGEPLKAEYKGVRIEKLGSQSDVAATLINQMNGDVSRYPWSKDLLNPNSPEFACHTITRGYGWVTPLGGMTYQMEMKSYLENTFPENVEKEEVKKGQAFLTQIYADYKAL